MPLLLILILTLLILSGCGILLKSNRYLQCVCSPNNSAFPLFVFEDTLTNSAL